MKMEMDETSGWTTFACVVIVALICGALGGCYLTEQTKQEAFKAGLVQKQNPGSAYTIWSKP